MINDKITHSSSENCDMDKEFDKINYRKNFIINLLKGKKVNPLIDFENCNTEALENSKKDTDVREVLNKMYVDFYKFIHSVKSKLTYIKSGSTGHTFKATSTNTDNDFNYAIKVVAMNGTYGDVNNIKRPENAELMMLRVLSYFVINNQTPHIVLPIGIFNTDIKPFIDIAKDKIINNKKYDQFYEKYKKKEFHDEVSILISEWANGGDLLDYMRQNYKTMGIKEWRVIFFQILSVLSIIHKKYPDFRHNDLKANNILIQKIENRKTKNIYHYNINDNHYYVPNIGIQIKIWDFDFACIPNVVDNLKVSAKWTSKINVKPERNQYYDIHYFFNTFTRKGFFPEFLTEPQIPQKVKEFVKRVVPEKYTKNNMVTERGRILENIEYTTPSLLIKEDEFFIKLREVK